MRNFGGLCLLVGVAGFLYFSSQMGSVPALPEGLGISESMEHAAGRYEIARYVSAFVGFVGVVLALFPKGR